MRSLNGHEYAVMDCTRFAPGSFIGDFPEFEEALAYTRRLKGTYPDRCYAVYRFQYATSAPSQEPSLC